MQNSVTPSAPLDGSCEPRFAAVRDRFARLLADGDESGGAVSFVLDGEPVVDLWGGWRDAARTTPWQRDTIATTFSVTKWPAALTVLRLIDDGRLALESVGYRGTVTTDAASAAPPVAARNPIVRSHHGDDVEDAYEWFRAKEDAAVIAHLEAENAYTQERTAHLSDLQTRIFDEIKGRTLETDLSVPTRRGDWWYYGRSHEDKQYGASCRCPRVCRWWRTR